MRQCTWRWMTVSALLALGLCPQATEVNFRLVDAVRGAPLEFWKKDINLPDGIMYSRYPTVAFVDGKQVDYAAYGGDDKSGGKVADDINRENVPEPVVDSDRKQEVTGDVGVKALVRAELAEGAHLFQPGNLRFTVSEKDGLTSTEPSLLLKTPVCYYVRCYPVDINLLHGTAGPKDLDVSVTCGKETIYEESLAPAKKPAVLRLYLPVSSENYQLDFGGFGKLSLNVAATGVRVQDASPGLFAAADGFTVALRQGEPAPAVREQPAGEAPGELYLFTDRAREVYLEGERVQFSLRAWGTAAKVPRVECRLEGSAVPFPLPALALQSTGDGAFAESALDTALLRPGDYTLRALAGETTSNPLNLHIAPLLPATNMKIFSHVKWGGMSLAPDDLTKLADLGFNTMTNGLGGWQGFNAVMPQASVFDAWQGTIPTDPARVKAFAGPHCPPELSELRTPVSRGMETMLARGVQFLPVYYGLIHYFNVGDDWRDQADDRYQVTCHAGMLLRRYPNFAGSAYCTGDGPTPASMGSVFASAGVASFDVIHEQRMKRLRELFTQKYGKIEVDLSGPEKVNVMTDELRRQQEAHGLAWGFRVGEDIPMKVSGDDDKAFIWGQWVNDLYPESFRTVRGKLEQMVRDPLVTCGASWGIGAGGGMYPGTFYRALDFSLNDMHGDYGVCNFNYITGCDILSMGMEDAGARPWVGMDMIKEREDACGYKLLLEALSRNPAGVGVLNLTDNDWICGWAGDKRKSETLAQMTEIARRFGDLYTTLHRADEIGVVSSFREEVLGKQPFRALWAAHYITQKAGYQANVVTDAYCAKHAGELSSRFRALLLFNMTKALSPGFTAALEQFRQAGGVILVDAATTVEVPGAVKLPFAVPASQGPSNSNDHLAFEAFFLPMIRQFRATVAPLFAPYFAFASQQQPHNAEINWSGIRSRSGDLEYWTVFNDGKPNIDDGVAAQFRYQGDTAVVTANGAGVVYDALRRVKVETAPAGNGVRFTCDARHFPGSIYLLAPRPLLALAVTVSTTARQGQAVTLCVQALDAAGAAFTGLLPVEVTVTDPAGVVRYDLFRTTNQEITLKIAANDPTGTWTWRATDQVIGLTAAGSFTVTAAQTQPGLATVDSVYDADAVQGFLKRKIAVTLTGEETALLPQARALVDGLKARGVDATLKLLWPSNAQPYPMQWFYRSVEDLEVRDGVLRGDLLGWRVEGKNHLGDHRRDNFGTYAYYKQYTGSAPWVYYRDTVLLGRDDVTPGPLLGDILRGRMLLRNPTASFPTAGQGMVGYAWGPFQAEHDAVVVYGAGKDGLDKAIASLLKLAAAQDAPVRAYTPPMARKHAENGETFREFGIAVAGGETTVVRGEEQKSVSLLPPDYPYVVKEAAATASGVVAIYREPQGAESRCMVLNRPNALPDVEFTLPANLAPANAAAVAWHLGPGGGKRWPAQVGTPVGNDYLTPADFGMIRCSQTGLPSWSYDPYPLFHTYNEAKYPRRVRNYALSADGATALAAFSSRTPNQEFIPYRHNRCDVVLLDAATGNALATVQDYHGDWLLLAKDGSRFAVADLLHTKPNEHTKRDRQNPHDCTGLGMFDRTGHELSFIPLPREVEHIYTDEMLTLALVTYTDAGRRVSVLDLTNGTSVDVQYPRVDVGAVVSPEGRFAVVTFSDGVVMKLGRDGAVLGKSTLPVPGTPVMLPGEPRLLFACPDGACYREDEHGVAPIHHIAALPAPVTAVLDPLPAVLEAPVTPGWWVNPPVGVKVTASKAATFTLPPVLHGEQRVTMTLPALQPMQTLLAAFTYHLHDANDTLEVQLTCGEVKATYRFPAHLQDWPAAIPLRFKDGGEVSISVKCAGEVTLGNARLLQVDAGAWANAALTRENMPPSNAPLPRLMVPNVFGLVGDPRAEQMSSGLKGVNIYRCFDGDVYSGDRLYEVKYPQNAPWDGGAEPDLRSARIVLEYHTAHTILGFGLWSLPGDLPVEGWTLECCDRYTIDALMTKELKADWKLVAAGRGNTQYFALYGFKPVSAKIWRFTISRTPAKMQSLAELELYEDTLDNPGDNGDEGGDPGLVK